MGPVNPAPPEDQYPEVLEAALRAFLTGGWEAGAVELEPIAREVWRGKVPRAVVIVAAPATQSTLPMRSRRFTAARAGATFRRDGFHCRYCGGRVIPVALVSVLSHVYPEQLPYTYTYKGVHPVYWTRGAEADHIEPGSKGGHWEDPNNHATACVRCNTAKSDLRLQDIGWELRESPTRGWGGLTAWYERLWDRAGRPNPRYHLPWMRALAPHEP